ncbi:MAG: hypothetical protein PF637_03070 [Spirochaetes bacterium]|nr:hypothetical protein [Spirochaetota bacterium]
MRIVLIICSVMVLLSAKSLNLFDKKIEGPESAVQAEKETGQVIYTVKYKSRGTRSERRIGVLTYKTVEIPYIFTFIQHNNQAFSLKKSNHRWGSLGYQPIIKKEIKKGEQKAQINATGYCLTETRDVGIPDDWAYVEWNGGKAFINLERLSSVLKEPPFKDLPSLFFTPGRIK